VNVLHCYLMFVTCSDLNIGFCVYNSSSRIVDSINIEQGMQL
jgi:hypothetical protein